MDKYKILTNLSQFTRSIIKMNNMEKFCLRWNDFDTNIKDYFRELREEHSYTDVTLATDDHYQIIIIIIINLYIQSLLV